jgi:hypothetical protein
MAWRRCCLQPGRDPVAPYHDILKTYVGFFSVAAVAGFAAFALWYLYNSRVRKVKNFRRSRGSASAPTS